MCFFCGPTPALTTSVLERTMPLVISGPASFAGASGWTTSTFISSVVTSAVAPLTLRSTGTRPAFQSSQGPRISSLTSTRPIRAMRVAPSCSMRLSTSLGMRWNVRTQSLLPAPKTA